MTFSLNAFEENIFKLCQAEAFVSVSNVKVKKVKSLKRAKRNSFNSLLVQLNRFSQRQAAACYRSRLM